MFEKHITIYRNLVNNYDYKIHPVYGVMCRCKMSGEWFPTAMTVKELMRVATSYTIKQETRAGRYSRKLSGFFKRIAGGLIRV